jgi:hypothetical protein
MPIEGCISLNRARAKENSAITRSINQANNTPKPVEVVTKVGFQVLADNEKNNKCLLKQDLQNASSEVAIAFPHENYIQQGLQIIKNNPDIGKLQVDTRDYENMDRNIYTSVTTTFNHDFKIFFPSDTHMVAAVAYYKKKYDINIHIVCEVQAYKTYELIQQLNDGEQLGVIARPAQFIAHVTPLIISKQGEDIFIIILDSVDDRPEFAYIIEDFFKEKLINLDDKKNYHLILADGDRQADSYSCRNDAFIILKDALRKPNVVSYFEPFKQELSGEFYQSSADDKFVFKTYSVQLPLFLFKTIQIDTVLANFTDEDKSTILKISKDGDIKTLQTHLDKYKRSVVATTTEISYENQVNPETNTYDQEVITEEKKCIINVYLQMKGFLMLVTVFPELSDAEGKIDASKQELLLSKYFYADS